MPSFMTLRLQTAEIKADKQTDRQTDKPTMCFISIDNNKDHIIYLLTLSFNQNIYSGIFTNHAVLHCHLGSTH